VIVSRTNIVLAVLLVVVVILTASSRVDYSRPNIEVLPDMKYTPAWTAFSRNPNFRNGRTLQAPVPGTIARGEHPLHFAATMEGAVRAGEELRNPYDVHTVDNAEPASIGTGLPGGPGEASQDEAGAAALQDNRNSAREHLRQSVQRGSDVYRVFCICCHGPSGLGDGPVPKRGFPPPPSLLTGKSPQMKDGQLFHILTYGQGSMSSFAAQLSPERRWDVINYIRGLQQNAPSIALPAVIWPASESNASSDEQRDKAPTPSESKEEDNVQ